MTMTDIKERLRLVAQDPRKSPELQQLLLDAAGEIGRLEKDAQRYRFLRDHKAYWFNDGLDRWSITFVHGATFEAAIAQQDKRE
jgi:hypothetical protein